MAVESISFDDDEFCFSLMPRLEESFAITLPDGFAALQTAGQLFDGVLSMRIPDGTGIRCDSAMVFYRLRRAFARSNRGARIVSSSPLSDLTDESPKALAKRLHRETGLRMPPVELSKTGCLFALVTLIVAPLAWLLVDARTFAIVAVAGAIPFWLDRGGFTGPWQSIGTLATAIAQDNVALLAEMGARNRPQDWWRRFTEILADAALPLEGEMRPLMASRIGRDTRLKVV